MRYRKDCIYKDMPVHKHRACNEWCKDKNKPTTKAVCSCPKNTPHKVHWSDCPKWEKPAKECSCEEECKWFKPCNTMNEELLKYKYPQPSQPIEAVMITRAYEDEKPSQPVEAEKPAKILPKLMEILEAVYLSGYYSHDKGVLRQYLSDIKSLLNNHDCKKD